MRDQHSQNIQDLFLNTARKSKTFVTVFLTDGLKLQGIISSFDNFSLVLKKESSLHLVYKHAISMIVPQGAFSTSSEPKDEGEGKQTPK
ncbi:MAG: RNA chaperone Hfq [Holosporales bacterium]|jgi:host factor-I protein|nr:RNA chaperone Hfq [Holosporales bacterium]